MIIIVNICITFKVLYMVDIVLGVLRILINGILKVGFIIFFKVLC